MKKLILLSAVLLGAASASYAGVHFSIGIGLPLPGVVISAGTPAPVYYPQAPVYAPAPRAVYAPAPAMVVAPPAVYFGVGPYGHGYYRYGHPYYRHGYGGRYHGYR